MENNVYVGIDVAKNDHYACIVNADGTVAAKSFKVTNDQAGFATLVNYVANFTPESLLFGLESTSIYGENLIAFLYARGFRVAVINPMLTANKRKIQNRSSTKTDKIDAKIICDYLRTEEYRLLKPNEVEMLQIRGLCRFRMKLRKQKARLKTQLTGFVDQGFPELPTLFAIHGKAAYAMLSLHSSPEEIAGLNLTYLSNLLTKRSRGHFGKDTARNLKALAKSSVGARNAVLHIQIAQTISQVELLEFQLAELDAQIETAMDALDSVIKSVPGIGNINGAMILSEIGDISRFATDSQLCRFAGLNPVIRQSGKWSASRTRMSKQGSSYLRYALVNAAWNVCLNDATFRDYYDLKVAQGRGHYAALGHVAHKLIRVLFKLLKTDSLFDPLKLAA